VTPPIQNQLDCGGCWAFSASEAVSVSVNINEQLSSPSEQIFLSAEQLLECNVNSINDGCSGGSPQLGIFF
jgi:C1A family cysteine protease